MGMFDDLIPAPAATRAGGMFDDLIPSGPAASVLPIDRHDVGGLASVVPPILPRMPSVAIPGDRVVGPMRFAKAPETLPSAPLVSPQIPDASQEVPLDLSSAGGDLAAGIEMLGQIIPGLKAGNATKNIASELQNNSQNRAAYLQRQADALREELPNMPSEEERLELLDQIAQMEMQAQSMMAGRGPDQDILDREVGNLASVLPDIMASNARVQEIPVNPAAQAVMEAETLAEGIGAFADDPTGAARTFALRSLPASAPTIGATVLGSILGPIGAAGAGGGVGHSTERGLSLAQDLDEAFRTAGVDTSDETAIIDFISQDPQRFEGMISEAMKRANIIGGMDAVTGGITGALARAAAQSGKAKRVATAAASGTAIEPVGEGAGEALAGGGPGDVIAEMVGGAATGAPTTLGQIAVEATKNAPQQPVPADEEPPAQIPEEPTEVAVQETPAAPVPPEAPEQPVTEKIYTPDNEEVEVTYEVVEADDVISSDQEGFPQERQPRDRSTKASETAIEGIANDPRFGRLYRAPETDRGAPVVDESGVVDSGNGRIIALRRAYERGTAERYRQELTAKFPQAAGMRQPVVIARRRSEVDEARFAYRSNIPATADLTKTEGAIAEANFIDDAILGQYRGGDLATVQNRPMVKAFVQKLPKAQHAALMTPEGGLSKEGLERFQGALFAKAYGSDRLVRRMAEDIDDDTRSITNALLRAAPSIAQIGGAIERGEVSPIADFSRALVQGIEQISDFRRQGMDLAGFEAQIDAFADPVSEDVAEVMKAFYNPEGTRIASQKAIQDFFRYAAEDAMKQKVDQADLPGVEGEPIKTAGEIVRGAREKAQTESVADAPKLLDRTGPDPQRSREQRSPDDTSGTPTVGREEERQPEASKAPEPLRDAAKPAEKPKSTNPRKPQPGGTLSPTFLDFSYTDRNSVFEAAFRASGIEPDAARLLTSNQQISRLRDVLQRTYGVRVEIPQMTIRRKSITGRQVESQRNKISDRDAIDQLLDAYRQMEMLAHVLGVPREAIGLKNDMGSLVLSLESNTPGALGMYKRDLLGGRSIHLPGRSNSFAHEWGHALDHWMNGYLFDGDTVSLLSEDVWAKGIDPSKSQDQQTAQAFVGLLQALFGDRAKLAALQIDLQQQSAEVTKTGKPTPKAKKATKLLKDIEAGKKLPASVRNQYFKTSKEFDDMWGSGGYFTNPVEMLARAFEAFVGVKASMSSDLPTSFLSKPDWAYSASDEPRAAMTFPRGVEAEAIFPAFEEVGRQLRKAGAFGSKTGAKAPADNDVFDIRTWDRWKPKGTLLEREKDAWRKSKTDTQKAKQGPSGRQNVADVLNRFASSYSGYLQTIVRRQPEKAQKALQNIVDMVATDPGSGRKIGQVWEEAVEARFKRDTNRFDAIIGEHKLQRLNDEEMRELRLLLTVADHKTDKPHLRAGAANLRRLMDDVWRYVSEAGVKIGYAKNGWLPRMIDMDAVTAEPGKFIEQAQKVYRVVFNRDVRNSDLEGQISDVRRLSNSLGKAKRSDTDGSPYSVNLFSGSDLALLKKWRSLVAAVTKAQKKLEGIKDKDGDKLSDAQAKLEEAMDAFMPIHDDVLDMLEGVYSLEAANAWRTKIETGSAMDFDTKGPDSQFLKRRSLPAEADEIMVDFYKGDPLTLIQEYLQIAPRRAEYVRRFGANSEKLEGMLTNAGREGADGRDVREIRHAINALTGRNTQHSHSPSAWAMGWAYTAATVTLLKRTFFSSLAEPAVAGLRTGRTRDSLRAVINTVGQIAHTGDAKARRDLARAIGLITSAQHETIMINRHGGDLDPSRLHTKILSQFFQRTLLTGLTNVQRAGVLATTGITIHRHLKAALDGKKASINELNDLGIGQEHHKDMLEWLDGLDGDLPTPEDLLAVDGGYYNKAAALWSAAATRHAQQIIQNPRRFSRPAAALEPHLRLMYGITGFIFSFHTNVLKPLFVRNMDDRRSGETFAHFAARRTLGTGRNLARVAPAFGVLFAGHLLATIVREALFNREQWEKQEEEDNLEAWLMERAFFRTGIFGAWDPVTNLWSGVKYERDLAGAYAGPHMSWHMSNVEDIIGPLAGRNSPNTNTSEKRALETGLDIITDTGSSLVLSALPGGPLLSPAYGLGMWGIDAANPSELIAEEIFRD